MRLKNEVDLVALIQKAQSCSGEVVFATGESDRLNLKSTLSQYLLVMLAREKNKWKQGSVLCENQADYQLLADFLQPE